MATHHTYRVRSVFAVMISPRSPAVRWVSYAFSLVVLYVDSDPQRQQRVVEPTSDDPGRPRGV